jgi:hypothetical protein
VFRTVSPPALLLVEGIGNRMSKQDIDAKNKASSAVTGVSAPKEKRRACMVCTNPQDLKAINELLLAGYSLRAIERKYKISIATLSRHRAHIPQEQKDEAAAVIPSTGSLVERIDALIEDNKRTGRNAENNGHYSTAVASHKVHGWLLELRARATHELEQAPTNVFNFQMCDGFRRAAEARRAQTIDIQPEVEAAKEIQ